MAFSAAFDPVQPRPLPEAGDCAFYHCIDFDDGSSVTGPWDLRGRFAQYIGNYPIAGKTMLDVGTASGFLTFSAEEAGAQVTALEGRHGSEYCQLHFKGQSYHEDRHAFDAATNISLERLKNGFWYSWRKKHSLSEVVYVPLSFLPYWERRFDVVLAGAILEHLSDPVSTIWALTQLAREAVIIAFTPVLIDDALIMSTANDWSNPEHNYTWWNLSSGLYRQIFANVGFTIELIEAIVKHDGVERSRPTIVARRR